MAEQNYVQFAITKNFDLSQIPRRKRRFFRNKNLVLQAISKHVEKLPDVKEAEKRKIIEELKYKLDQLAKEELFGLAERLFEQLSSEQANAIIATNIKQKKMQSEQLTKKDIDEIVDNIYVQLRDLKARKQTEEPLKKPDVKEAEIKRIKERLASLKQTKEKPKEAHEAKPLKGLSKEDEDIFAEIAKAEPEEFEESDYENEESLESLESEKDDSIFAELEKLSQETKKRKK